jgi:hypothetical protein
VRKAAARRKRFVTGARTAEQERRRLQRQQIRADIMAKRELHARAVPMDDSVRSPTADPPEEL